MKLHSQKGSSIVLALISMLALAIISTTIFSYFIALKGQQNRQILLNSIQQVQANVIETINSDAAWDRIKAGNPIPVGAVTFKLVDATGATIYDSTLANYGYDVSGKACTTYDGTSSNPCILRLDLRWAPIATCAGVSPAYQISGTYSYGSASGNTQIPINWITYNNQLNFCRPVATKTFFCVGGAPSSPTCATPNSWVCTSNGWVCGQIFH